MTKPEDDDPPRGERPGALEEPWDPDGGDDIEPVPGEAEDGPPLSFSALGALAQILSGVALVAALILALLAAAVAWNWVMR